LYRVGKVPRGSSPLLTALLDAVSQIRRLADEIMQPMNDTITRLGRVD
jgi:hypothetical protein